MVALVVFVVMVMMHFVHQSFEQAEQFLHLGLDPAFLRPQQGHFLHHPVPALALALWQAHLLALTVRLGQADLLALTAAPEACRPVVPGSRRAAPEGLLSAMRVNIPRCG